MHLKFIFSIKTKPGLFIAQNKIKEGFVAESLLDGHKEPVKKGSAEAYCLADIELYGKNGMIRLKHVFHLMQLHPTPAVHDKEHVETVKAYFLNLIPDLDTKRVFANDMRKIITWFNLLNGKVNFGDNFEEQQKGA